MVGRNLYLLTPAVKKSFTLCGRNSRDIIRCTLVRHIVRPYTQGKKNAILNTAPIEFIANNSPLAGISDGNAIKEAAKRTLRCTDDVSDEHTEVVQKNLPFNVKPVDGKARAALRKQGSEGITKKELKKKLEAYVQLSKPRLTILVMLSAICSYALSPYPATVMELICLSLGTTMCSASANSINMGREPDYDRQMVRTQARPVVRGAVTPKQAFAFATGMGSVGVSILYAGVNPTVAALGLSNIVLYSWIYTSLKRKHIINTWVGALVGAIPPLMGWAAASPLTHPAAWCLAGLLYAWQFPHFNTLSHNIRNEYKNAGYVMTAWKNPLLNARVALRYSLLMFPLCFGLSYFNVTDWYYQIDSGLVNAWLCFWSFKFYMQQRLNYSSKIRNDRVKFNEGLAQANVYARKAFFASVLHLPAVLILAILHKKNRWNWLFEDKENPKLAN
ncbi:Protoheme IX farnesyltransferase, mitochondrial [Nakaseomyces bracarensis]|uniref:Protoheme IX farnesyltransferase, mitochondrial n=1 Tax=Nakaseomyces bracarensis TaxID=273131 RepID=A0ABR4NZD0_9SACH